MQLSTKSPSIANPDIPVYRIFPVWAFEEVLRTRSIVLRSPSVWQDPYEDPARNVLVESIPPKPDKTGMLLRHLPPAFVQCWSKTGASDALLRAYSRVSIDKESKRNVVPVDEGVQVRSTPRKLRDVVKRWVNEQRGFQGFTGDVLYVSEDAIQQGMAGPVLEKGTRAFDTPQLRAGLLFVKREYFSHEAEFRIVVVGQLDMAEQTELRIPIDPNEVFEEATYDPRLTRFELIERWNVAKDLGYTGKLVDRSTYHNVWLCLPTKCEIDDDDRA